jgi:hypothetical protein
MTVRPYLPGLRIVPAAILLVGAGCASTGSPPDAAPDTVPPVGAPLPGEPADDAPGLLELCRIEPPGNGVVDETRRMLQETFCGATLWLDGLFGGEPDVASARRTSGRVEMGLAHSDFHGLDPDFRLRLRYSLPTLSERLSLFLGRTDFMGFLEDREEGHALRSSTLDRQAEEQWLTGLGYGPPGRWAQNVNLRAGVRPGTSPGVFVQARYQRNVRVTDLSLWRIRETLFWERTEGFGATTGIEYDRALAPDLLLHWRTVATLSEASQGVEWRSAVVAYRHLGGQRGVAGELFVLGATSAPIPLLEYGVRGVFRHPLRAHLFGELLAGYSWPRHDWEQERSGSPMIGLGMELYFGVLPF